MCRQLLLAQVYKKVLFFFLLVSDNRESVVHFQTLGQLEMGTLKATLNVYKYNYIKRFFNLDINVKCF